jgi:phosphate transport system substrate-binding protein
MEGYCFMQVNIFIKITLLILSCLPIIFISFIGSIVTFFLGTYKFYVPFIVVSTIGVLFFVCNGFFKFLNPRIFRVSFISFISLCLIAVIINESINAYHNSFETLQDAEVNLRQYQPFREDSKVASLKEESTLKIDGDLPILDGATALYPLYSAFVKATYPENQYNLHNGEVMANKTNQAYDNLIQGRVDMIFVAGPSERQLEYADRRGVELKLTPIGKEAFVFFVNSKNPVKGLTTQQIKDIYTGKIINWAEIGGKNDEIKAFQRPKDSGSQTTLEKFMGNTPIMEPLKEDVVTGMGGIIEQTSNYKNYKNAIGYSFRYFSMDMVKNDSIRHLKIDNVYPKKETIRSGEYPLSYEFYAVTAGSGNPNIEPLLNWILSEQGQVLVEKTGYVPIVE